MCVTQTIILFSLCKNMEDTVQQFSRQYLMMTKNGREKTVVNIFSLHQIYIRSNGDMSSGRTWCENALVQYSLCCAITTFNLFWESTKYIVSTSTTFV